MLKIARKSKNLTSDERGMHELLTAFLLVVLVVSIVLMLIYFNYQGALRQSAMTEQIYKMRYYTTLRNQIDNCIKAFEKNDTAVLISDVGKCVPNESKGYSIERIANYDCNYGYFEAGDINNCETQLIFYSNIPQDMTKSCLVKMRVCIGDYPRGVAIKEPTSTVVIVTPTQTETTEPTPEETETPTGTQPPTPTTTEEDTPPGPPSSGNQMECMTISQNAQPNNAFDIVLLSSNFKDRAEFISKVNELTLHIFSLEPFSRNKSKINIYAVFVTSSLGCKYDNQIDRYLKCDWSLATTAASKCASFDRALVLHREDRYGGAGQFWGQMSASYCGTYTSKSGTVYNSLWKDVAVHELAHTLGLLDEYVVNQNESATSVENWLQNKGKPIPPYMRSGSVPWNCSTSNCSEWSSFTNIDCTKGCSLNDWHRPKAKNSIMYDVLGGFSAPADNMVENAIKYFAG